MLRVPLQEGLAASQTALLFELPLRIIIIIKKSPHNLDTHRKQFISLTTLLPYYLKRIDEFSTEFILHSFLQNESSKWTQVSCLSSRCGTVEIAVTITTKLDLRNVAPIFTQKPEDNRGNGLSFQRALLIQGTIRRPVCKANSCLQRKGK